MTKQELSNTKRTLTREIKELKEYLEDITRLSNDAKAKDSKSIGYFHFGKFTSHYHVDNTRLEIEVKEKKRKVLNKIVI